MQAIFEAAYRAVQEGDPDVLSSHFTADALVFGPSPDDTWHGEQVATRIRQTLLPIGLAGDAVRVEESRVTVAIEEGARTAWAYDLPRAVVTSHAQDSVWLPRVTAHLVREGDDWKIDALHVSLGVPDEVLTAPDAARRLLPPAGVPNQRPIEADQIVGLIRRALDDYGVKVDRSSDRPEFLQLGTSPAEVFGNGAGFKALLRPQLAAIKKAGFTFKLDGNLAVKLSPGGRSGWAAAVVVQRVGTGKKQQVYPPFRYLWTVSEEDGVWNITSEHLSLAVNPDLRESATPDDVKAWRATRQTLEKARAATPPKKTESGVSVW